MSNFREFIKGGDLDFASEHELSERNSARWRQLFVISSNNFLLSLGIGDMKISIVQNQANRGCGETVETGAWVVIYFRDDMTLFSELYCPEFLKRFQFLR
jgi:hypothetical protein